MLFDELMKEAAATGRPSLFRKAHAVADGAAGVLQHEIDEKRQLARDKINAIKIAKHRSRSYKKQKTTETRRHPIDDVHSDEGGEKPAITIPAGHGGQNEDAVSPSEPSTSASVATEDEDEKILTATMGEGGHKEDAMMPAEDCDVDCIHKKRHHRKHKSKMLHQHPDPLC